MGVSRARDTRAHLLRVPSPGQAPAGSNSNLPPFASGGEERPDPLAPAWITTHAMGLLAYSTSLYDVLGISETAPPEASESVRPRMSGIVLKRCDDSPQGVQEEGVGDSPRSAHMNTRASPDCDVRQTNYRQMRPTRSVNVLKRSSEMYGLSIFAHPPAYVRAGLPSFGDPR